MTLSRGLRATLLAVTTLALVFVYAPLGLVVLNSFNTNKSFAWPPSGLTMQWWSAAAHSEGARAALLVSVDGLAIEGLGDRLRTMLLHAQNRHVIFSTALWNIVGDTAADGLLLRVPRWADYPGKFALDSESSTVGFEKVPGFLTGVDDSTTLKLHFYAVPLDAPAIEGRGGRAQKR